MTCILLWSSFERVHDSQSYRKMGVTRERISHIFELREILLSFSSFNLVNTAVVCAILEGISGLEPSSVITDPRYFKLLSIYFNLCENATDVVYHQFGFLGRGCFVKTLN